eukprot:5597379-Amphidinium_carterae.1
MPLRFTLQLFEQLWRTECNLKSFPKAVPSLQRVVFTLLSWCQLIMMAGITALAPKKCCFVESKQRS